MSSTSDTPRMSGVFSQSQITAAALVRRLASLPSMPKRSMLKPATVMSFAPASATACGVPLVAWSRLGSYHTCQEFTALEAPA